MESEILQKARTYAAKAAAEVPPDALPVYHLTGGTGWLNDPNGFSLYRGEVHLFYQFYPYDTRWGPMHWGHGKTKDFVRWERLPEALAPDQDYDKDGCFSGSAIETPEGKHLLLSTGVRRDAAGGVTQTQCVAVGDGVDYEKSPENPVITGALLPPGGSTADFRDPKLWREGDEYRAVAANRAPDGGGQILLYASADALRWRYLGVIAESRGRWGKMWECPDFFPLDQVQTLLVSPQEMRPEGLEFHPGYGAVCLLGRWDGEGSRMQIASARAVDYGLDFYAPQTLQMPDGRRVMIAWMQNWETVGHRPEGLPVFGQMTFPRELRVRNGRLLQTPVRELSAYRTGERVYRDVPVRGEIALPGVTGRVLDLTLTLRPEPGAPAYRNFVLTAAADDTGRYGVELRYEPERGVMRVDRTRSGPPWDIVNQREFYVSPGPEGALKLRLLLDRYSLELFAGEGEQAASSVIYSPREADRIRFFADGAARLDVEKYDLTVRRDGPEDAGPNLPSRAISGIAQPFNPR